MKRLMLFGMAGLIMASLALASCQREQTGHYLQLSGRIFEFNYRLSRATYVVTYKVLEAIPEGSSTQTEFEDPRGGPPIVTVAQVYPFWEKVVLTSPPVHCIVKDRTYAVKVTLKGPDGAVLQKLETSITSTLDQTLLPENSLVVGPAYDMNPKVFKPGGIADYHPDTGCPK